MRATVSYGSPRKERTPTVAAFYPVTSTNFCILSTTFQKVIRSIKKYMSCANFGGREGDGSILMIRDQFDRHLLVTQRTNIAS